MQSSTAVMCRAMVMLACLAVIPLIALFGNSLPDVVTNLVERVRGRLASVTAAQGDAPQFMAADVNAKPNMPPPLSDGPRVCLPNSDPSNRLLGTAGAPSANPVTNSAPGPFDPAADATVPVGYNAPIGVAAGNNAREGVTPPGPAPSWPGGSTPPPATASTTPTGGAFVEIQERLRGLGATYYRLESWGTEQRLFRFQCAMMMGGPNLTQHFEATDNDPLRAMCKVLSDVEAWKTRR